MTRARLYPLADARTQWFERTFARGSFDCIEKILLHTTETTGWPGYAGGSMAPTLTYHPRLRRWRQHNYLDRSARALVDPTSTPVRENRDNVIQIEIIAYADEKLAGTVGGLPVSQLTDEQLGDLAAFIAFVRGEWGGPPLVAAKFLPYPQSAGDSSVRMSGSEYDAFRGILGHQHASGNGHGDPGALNVARILKLAGGTSAPAPVTAPEVDIVATKEELKQLIDEALDSRRVKESADRVLGGIPGGHALGRLVDGGEPRLADNGDTGLLAGLLRSIATQVGAPIDETALAAAVVEGLGPQLTEAVKTAAAGLGVTVPVDQLAAAVVSAMGTQLTKTQG